MYCGAVRLKYASQYLAYCQHEHYLHLREALYKQFSTTITQTVLVILEWLANH